MGIIVPEAGKEFRYEGFKDCMVVIILNAIHYECTGTVAGYKV